MTYVDYISVKPRENNQETNQKVKKNSVLRKSRIQGGGKGSCCLMGSRGSTQRSTAKLVPRRERCHPRVGAGDVCSVPTLGSHGSHDACKTPVNTRPWPPAADILPRGKNQSSPAFPGLTSLSSGRHSQTLSPTSVSLSELQTDSFQCVRSLCITPRRRTFLSGTATFSQNGHGGFSVGRVGTVQTE